MPKHNSSNTDRLNKVVADAQRQRTDRERGYREQALKLYPWICGRCQREFTRENLQELTVHHRNHDHDYNPTDGSNWELLCVYCHDNEHSRLLDHVSGSGGAKSAEVPAKHQPFAALQGLFKDKA